MTNPNAAREKKEKKEAAKSMEDLLAKMGEKYLPPKEGDLVEATVLSLGKNKIWLDVGGHAVGVIEGRELSENKHAIEDLAVGDKISAQVVEAENEDGQLVLSLKAADTERGWKKMEEYLASKENVKVHVLEANRGGLLVESEGVKGFLPVSQLSFSHYPRVEGGDKNEIYRQLSQLVGQTLITRVLTVDRENDKLIFSEREATASEELRRLANYKIGQTITGKVSGIVNFGAFVHFGDNIEGLIHISEIAWERVYDINKYLKVGDTVEAMIIGIEGSRVSLSRKRLLPDPWTEKALKYKEGEKVKGRVSRITPFGAFVELEEGLEGLLHASEIAEEGVVDLSKYLSLGDKKEFRIISIDAPAHRIALSLKEESKKT